MHRSQSKMGGWAQRSRTCGCVASDERFARLVSAEPERRRPRGMPQPSCHIEHRLLGFATSARPTMLRLCVELTYRGNYPRDVVGADIEMRHETNGSAGIDEDALLLQIGTQGSAAVIVGCDEDHVGLHAREIDVEL